MEVAGHVEVACNHWVARIRSRSGPDVSVHIHRGSPIPAREAMRIARKTVPKGKVASLDSLGFCQALTSDDDI